MRPRTYVRQLMAFDYPILGYCDRHPKEPVVCKETDLKTGEVKKMCRACWDEHRGRNKR